MTDTTMRDKIADILNENTDLGEYLFDVADAILAALPELTAPQWQPIETAPKDGTVIFVWHVSTTNSHATFDSNIKKAQYIPDLGEWSIDSLGGNLTPVLAGWMPLPAAPALVTQGEE
tara:strand:+ start:416 stop:769 length:354 start_codon:yes stop_codon:yes gene_type:complete